MGLGLSTMGSLTTLGHFIGDEGLTLVKRLRKMCINIFKEDDEEERAFIVPEFYAPDELHHTGVLVCVCARVRALRLCVCVRVLVHSRVRVCVCVCVIVGVYFFLTKRHVRLASEGGGGWVNRAPKISGKRARLRGTNNQLL